MDLMTFIKPLLRRRFTENGMWVESVILDHLGAKYYKGDRVTWEDHRRHAYKMWHMNKSLEDIVFYHEVPTVVVKWWIEIWTRYDNAWGFNNE